MRQTKGAIGNLLNRYKAVLKKCHLLNTFGSLAVAGMLVMGGVGVAADVQANVLINGEAISTESGNPATLFDAIIEAQDGDVITLTNSHSGGGLPTKVNNVDKDFKTKGLTIDLNENTYTITDPSVGSAGTETNGAQLLRDNIITIKNGTIISDGASFSTAILIQNYSNLTLENVILDGTNLKDHQSGNYTLSNNFGNINIKNSTIIAKEGGIAFDVYYGLSSSYTAEGVSVNVEDATITGKIEVTIDNNVTELAEGAKHELTLSGGKLTGNLTAGNGAQLENWGKTTISNVAIENNTASDKGGAIYNSDNKTGAQGELALNNVSLTGNKASFGGALWNDGTANISGKDFTGNNATSAGGAIYNNTDATLVLDGVTFERNTSAKSGAINNYDGTVTITGSQFKHNSADTGMGGAISNVSGKTDKVGTIKIVNSEFAGNNGGNGGAIWQGTEGSISITGSTFTNNTAVAEGSQQQGGAITNASNMEISSTTFDGNRAGGIGGAIANVVPQGNIGDGPNLQLSDVTVRNNWAGTSGGGIYNLRVEQK